MKIGDEIYLIEINPSYYGIGSERTCRIVSFDNETVVCLFPRGTEPAFAKLDIPTDLPDVHSFFAFSDQKMRNQVYRMWNKEFLDRRKKKQEAMKDKIEKARRREKKLVSSGETIWS